ncbi:MAG: choice-of-anchor D domain-containing protein [Terriglobia bacterium]
MCLSCGAGTTTQQQKALTYILALSPANISFGNVGLGTTSSQSVTLTNSGTAPIEVTSATLTGAGFGITGVSLPLYLPAGQSVSFNVTFIPTTATTVAGNLSVLSDAGNSPATMALSGTGAAPVLSATLTSISFGNVILGTTGTQILGLTNTGTVSALVSQATAVGAGFSTQGLTLPLTINPGSTFNFTVAFAPTVSGSVSGSLTLVSNATNSPLTLPLSGTGGTALLSASPTQINFGNVTLSTSSSQTVTLTNTGTFNVTVSQASVTGTGFSITGLQLPLTLTAGQSAGFNAVFTPASTGNIAGNLTVVSNATNSPAIVPVSGTGVSGGIITITPSPTVSFGNVMLGSSSTLPVMVSNTGSSTVTISQAVAAPSDFTLAPVSLPLTLTAGQSANLSVTYTPTAPAGVTGSLTITSDATNSPTSTTLTGSSHSVDLAWTASTSSNVIGYNIYRGTTTGGPYPTKVNSALVPATTFTDWTVLSGVTYFYVATAVDSSQNESVYSNESNPAAVPTP